MGAHDGGSRSVSRRIPYKKQALLGVLLLTALVTAVEGAAQVWAWLSDLQSCQIMRGDAARGIDPDTRRQICEDHKRVQHVFGYYKTIKPDQHYPTISINSHGFRGPEFEAQKPEGTYRIFVIGGSSVYGAGNLDNTTIPAHLERMYGEADLPFHVEVINAGVLGIHSHVEHLLVRDKILGMDPDLLIVHDGNNDIFNSVNNTGINERWSGLYNLFGADGYTGTYQHLRDTVYLMSLIDKHSKIIGAVKEHVTQPVSHDDPRVLEKVAAWKERWAGICDTGRERGFEVLVTVQPILGSGNQTLTGYYEGIYARDDRAGAVDKLRHWADALEDMSPPCTFTLDLAHAFDGHVDDPRSFAAGQVPASSVAFLDSVHLSDYGNREIASDMYDASVPIIMSVSVT